MTYLSENKEERVYFEAVLRSESGESMFAENTYLAPDNLQQFAPPAGRATQAATALQFHTIREAFSLSGSLKRLTHPEIEDNALPWYRSLTFVVNHDVPYNGGFRSWLLDPQDEHLAYAYILGKDGGVPLVFSDHNESAKQYPEDKGRWANILERTDILNMIHFHNTVHGKPMAILYESDTVLVFRRGDVGIVAINKSASEQWIEINTWGLKNPGIYQDLIHKHQMQLSGNNFSLYIPPRTAQMWLADET